MQARQADGVLSSQGLFQRSITNHSTPLKVNSAGPSNRIINSNKKRGKKRKFNEVIDLTPKKARTPSKDSDVEIIEPEPPTVIDLDADETYSCTTLTVVNAPAELESTTSDIRQNETSVTSANNDVSVIVDSSNEFTGLEALETTEVSNVIEIKESNIEPLPLYIRDANGGGSLKPPLYDLVSDDSFCFDSPNATPVSSQDFSQNKTLTNFDDSVVFVSETRNAAKTIMQRAEDFIPINTRRPGSNPFVSYSIHFQF